ncbi:MAG: metallophosphoesterase [Erysipelotrichales bacterium]|nr:metallophosphoesterase [Erysipelotrichales bacterium]
MLAKVKQITTPLDKRVICISDIHGYLDLFKRLLAKVKFNDKDILVILGDFYTKGQTGQNHETLKYIMELSERKNVYVLRGNCDRIEDYLTEEEKTWIENLPHIIESNEYIFVHGGIESENLDQQIAINCMDNDAFMEKGLIFKRYVITGHWPCFNYTHQIPCFNPIINEKQKIIAIDGGIIPKSDMGQLNAFMIENQKFSFTFLDDLPKIVINKDQQETCSDILTITWNDRHVEVVEKGEVFSLYKHLASGKLMTLPNHGEFIDFNGDLGQPSFGTNYYLPVRAGDIVSVVASFGNRIYAKKDGIVGWIDLD